MPEFVRILAPKKLIYWNLEFSNQPISEIQFVFRIIFISYILSPS